MRGGAIFFMLLLNALYFYEAVPQWLKHAPDDGFTLPDLGVPVFLFTLGISYRISFSRWLEKTGRKKTSLHFLLRFFLLWAMGFFGELMVFGHFTWGVLAAIGAVGLVSLPFLFLPVPHRLIAATVLLISYQLALLAGVPVYFINDGLGGPLATFAWIFPVLVAASCSPNPRRGFYPREMAQLFLTGLGLTFLGLALSSLIPLNKHKVSISYIMFTTGLSLVVFLGSYILIDIWKIKIPVFTMLGKNPLFVYMVSGVLSLCLNSTTPQDASLALLAVESLVILMISYFLAAWLHRQRIILRI